MEALHPGNAAQSKVLAVTDERYAEQAKTLSEAYSGAGTGVEQYSTFEDPGSIYASAVRANSPRLYVPQQIEPAELRMANSTEEVSTNGDVDCYVYNQKLVAAGQTPDPADSQVVFCQRTGPDMTVRMYPRGIGRAADQLATAVAATNELWAAVTGPPQVG